MRDAKAQAYYEEKLKERQRKEEETGKKPGGRTPKQPKTGPENSDVQANLTDPDAGIMRKNKRAGFTECYNAQAAVEVETMLIVSDAPNDKEQLEPALNSVSPAVGSIGKVLADSGYYSAKAVAKVKGNGEPGQSFTLP